MAYKHNDSCLQKAADDEPIFVLRAKDKLAPIVVRLWAGIAREVGCPEEKVQEAFDLADKMIVWQEFNTSKMPD